MASQKTLSTGVSRAQFDAFEQARQLAGLDSREAKKLAFKLFCESMAIQWPDNRNNWGGKRRMIQHFRFWTAEEEPEHPAHSAEYRDSNGNTLMILETEGEETVPASQVVKDWLREMGYDEPGDWELA
jgi:hypothetical protein